MLNYVENQVESIEKAEEKSRDVEHRQVEISIRRCRGFPGAVGELFADCLNGRRAGEGSARGAMLGLRLTDELNLVEFRVDSPEKIEKSIAVAPRRDGQTVTLRWAATNGQCDVGQDLAKLKNLK